MDVNSVSCANVVYFIAFILALQICLSLRSCRAKAHVLPPTIILACYLLCDVVVPDHSQFKIDLHAAAAFASICCLLCLFHNMKQNVSFESKSAWVMTMTVLSFDSVRLLRRIIDKQY